MKGVIDLTHDLLCSYSHDPQKNEIYFSNILSQILGVIQSDIALYSHVHLSINFWQKKKKKKNLQTFPELWPFANLGISF